MRKDRLKCLVDEYRLVQLRLDEIRGDQTKNQTSLEISKELEKDLKEEVEKAKNSEDSSLLKRWQEISNFISEDKDLPSQEEIKKANEKASGEGEKLIVYYERKLKSVRKLLGDRLAELVEGYAEKNILIGGGSSSEGSFRRVVDKEEEEKEITDRQKKDKDVNFTKM
ncbi:MAG: hypothetical protein K9L86_04585 [Candidatus Omnitrophica bacterium]|nr:hypothetical protein [Candidatus Omnitrophota bacterium]